MIDSECSLSLAPPSIRLPNILLIGKGGSGGVAYRFTGALSNYQIKIQYHAEGYNVDLIVKQGCLFATNTLLAKQFTRQIVCIDLIYTGNSPLNVTYPPNEQQHKSRSSVAWVANSFVLICFDNFGRTLTSPRNLKLLLSDSY